MVRLLLVDDEPRILASLRRAFRRRRSEWSVTLAESGDDAIAYLKREPFDVMVTDMRMPGLGGREVLQLSRDHQPDMVRIVMTGQTDLSSQTSILTLAHQLLAKPCDTVELMSSIDRIADLRRGFVASDLRAELGEVTVLPAAPSTCASLIERLDDSDHTPGAVVDLIDADPALHALFLKLASSSLVGVPVPNTHNTVAVLGRSLVRRLLIETKEARPSLPGVDRVVEGFRDHASRVAALAQRFAPPPLREAVRIAAMLHDAGWLFLVAHHWDLVRELMQEGEAFEGLHRRLQLTPADLSGYLLGIWGVPPPIVNGVLDHVSPKFEELGIAECLHIAEVIVHSNPTTPAWCTTAPLHEAGLQQLGAFPSLANWRDQVTPDRA